MIGKQSCSNNTLTTLHNIAPIALEHRFTDTTRSQDGYLDGDGGVSMMEIEYHKED